MKTYRAFTDVIEAWPSIAAFAADMGAPYPTVTSWRTRNSIPPQRWAAVVEAAEQRGVEGVSLASLAALAAGDSAAAETKEAAPARALTASGEPVFDNPFRHGFVRLATATPHVAIADPIENAQRLLTLAKQAHDEDVSILLFAELSITGYAIDDLLLQGALLESAEAAIAQLTEESRTLSPLLVVGAPLRLDGRLFNCAIAIHRGQVLAVWPKSNLPNYREFYEDRHFAPAREAVRDEVTLAGHTVPFGPEILLCAEDQPDCVIHTEICEDLWVATPPSSEAAQAGATVLLNLSASNTVLGKSNYRHALIRVQSARCMAAYACSSAGEGESTTDLAWDGHALIYENGELLGEAQRFAPEPQLIIADVDVERLALERTRTGSFSSAANPETARRYRRVPFTLDAPVDRAIPLARHVDRFPFVPSDPERLDELCFEAFNIQVAGLKQRLTAAGIENAVIGISGGLDSTHALLVAARTFDLLGLPRTNIRAYTLPAFATSEATRQSAWALMKALKVTAGEIDMEPAARQMLADIDHPFAKGEPVYDVTFENVQAGARTSLLFRLANHHKAIVLGTGDLSELALGWCTYGVGDHMSHYNVNGSAPKTLIQHLIRWCAETEIFGRRSVKVLRAVLNTAISPELVPGTDETDIQRTEDVVGPYELQDFNLYYITRYGLRPSKVAYLAHTAWANRTAGEWPPHMGEDDRREYTREDITGWLRVFLRRFFGGGSQFKRSAVPNGPKIGSGGSLSPRGDWRAPSDGGAEAWVRELGETSDARERTM